jgi:hypothetical protein
MEQEQEHERVEAVPREPRTDLQGEDEGRWDPHPLEPGSAAAFLTSCIWCRQLHQPERPFEFHPLCPVCTQPGG